MSDVQACAVVGVLLPNDAIHAARFRQLGQIVESRYEFLWRTLIEEGCWLDEAGKAIERVNQVLGRACLEELPEDPVARSGWFDRHADGMLDYKQSLRRFCRTCIADSRETAVETTAQAHILQSLESKGVVIVPVPVNGEGDMCGVILQDSRAVAAHKAKTHSVPSQLTQACVGTSCEVCQTQFWSQRRLRDHFKRSNGCLAAHLSADIGESGSIPKDIGPRLPVTRLVGPKPWWATRTPALETTVCRDGFSVLSFGSRLERVSSLSGVQSRA